MAQSYLDSKAKLQGRVAVIVGGGGGIGAACTLALAGAGVDVAFCDIDDEEMAQTEKAATEMGVRVLARRADVTDVGEFDAFYDAVAGWTGHLDIVVNVAGGVKRMAFMDGDREKDAGDIRRNFGYVIDSVRHAIPLLRNSGRGGSIINFTTIEAHRGAATFSVYAGAKAATTNFTKAMAVELGGERIRLNCVVPDTTLSKGNANAMPPELGEAMAKLPAAAQGIGFQMYIPLKAPPTTEDLANAVLYLASDLASSVTGTTLHVDGGTMAASGFLDWPEGDGFVPCPLAGTARKLVD